MDTEYDKSRLERLKRGLYKPGETAGSEKYDDLSPSEINVENNWGDTEIITGRKEAPHKSHVDAFLKILVVLAVLTSFASGGFLLYQYFDPLRLCSDKNILLTFETPIGVTPGIPASIVVHIANQNRCGLEYSNLSLIYPSGTRESENPSKDLHEQKKVLGTIQPNESVEFNGSAIFLGEENEEKEIRAVLEYRFEGVNSLLTKGGARPLRLLASPINLVVNTLKEVNAGQQLELTLSAVSNTVIPLRDILVKIEYPQGFTFSDADPKPAYGNNIWRVDSLKPADKFSVVIHGILEGADTQQRVFQTSIGVGDDKNERDISTLYGRASSEIVVKRPFIGITLSINGKPAGDATAMFGQRIEGVVEWKNNLPTSIVNAEIEVRLFGAAMDRMSIQAGSGGFYRSIDDTIFWDVRGNPQLSVLGSGQSGSVGFSFMPLPAVSGTSAMSNPEVTAEVTVRGKRFSDDPSKVPEEIKTVMAQTVRIASEIQFVARGVYFVGPLANSGPIPPRVEQETTYTMIWSIVNTSNNMANARVRGILPSYVKWYGSVYPSKELISYNKNTNEVIWSVGDIPAGTGIVTPPREVAFQVVLLPSLSQVNKNPALLTDIRLNALDSFTNTEVTKTAPSIQTDISTDPKASREDGLVVE
ncbi:MAG: hypothetical protein UY04_C0031G0010 [Parcubacteria group bacterium GW2011_GWA2_47_7]|nr:MAG: hypothetical protein UY04_C0031G0010 [Parcubacteria group bacterium GW2011_GWA2_47_7]